MFHICSTDNRRCVDNGHIVTGNQFLAAMIALFAVKEVGGSVKPEDAEVDVSWAVSADFEDAGDPEAGVGVVGVGVGVGRAEDVNVVVEG